VAKFKADSTLVSIQENAYEGKIYSKANFLFDDDGVILPLNIDSKVPDLLGRLKALPKFAKGKVELSVRTIKGVAYIDCTGFEVAK